jgi:hypothetical protein
MEKPMKRFTARRCRNLAILVVAAVACVLLDQLLGLSLRDATSISGMCLLAMVVFLTLYNAMKKMPYFPLGRASTWLQLHIYVALLSIVIFGLHVGLRVPGGVFNSVLAALYLAVALSGVFGLIVSRLFARRLTARGEEILFDRIGRKLGMLRRAAEHVVQRCLKETHSTLLPEFYTARLEPFFARHRNLGRHLVLSTRPQQAILTELDAQSRYLDDEESKYLAEIALLVEQKDDLDYQYVHHATLKYWLFVHVPLTYALLVFAALHLLLVFAY